MIRRLMLLGSATLLASGVGLFSLVSSGTTATASTPKFDNSTDTVHCGTFEGKTTISPALVLGGSSPTSISVVGKLYGCTDGTGNISGNDTSLSNKTPFSGVVHGTLSGMSNNLTTLAGCSHASGTLSVSWKGYYDNGTAFEHLLDTSTSTTLTEIYGNVFSPSSPFGTDNMTTPGYGEFLIGKAATDAGCTAPSAVTGGFLGTDGGVSSSSVAITSQDVDALLDGQANTATSTKLLLGIGALFGG